LKKADNIHLTDRLQHQNEENETRCSEEGGGSTGTRESETVHDRNTMTLVVQLSRILTRVDYINCKSHAAYIIVARDPIQRLTTCRLQVPSARNGALLAMSHPSCQVRPPQFPTASLTVHRFPDE
jgi:hypothetical protein